MERSTKGDQAMAVTLTISDLENIVGLDTIKATRLLPVVTQLVEEYTRGSTVPVELENEAAIRCAGYLDSVRKDLNIKGQKVDDLEVTYFSGSKSPLKASGAEVLLSPFKARRAV